MRSDKKYFRLGVPFLILALMIAAVPSQVFAQTPNVSNTNMAFRLSTIMPSASEMPRDFVLKRRGINDPVSVEHPLNPYILPELHSCSSSHFPIHVQSADAKCVNSLQYLSSYSMSGISPEYTTSYLISSYVFNSNEVALHIAELVQDDWNNNIANFVTVSDTRSSSGIEKAIHFSGEAQSVVYWYMSVHDNIATLAMVDGIDAELTLEAFTEMKSNLTKGKSADFNVHTTYMPLFANAESSNSSEVEAAEINSSWQTAYDVAWVQTTWYPHYGAKFSGHNGRNQYYTGGSTPPGFSGWTWGPPWGTRTYLLIDSSWRLANFPGSHDHNRYHALMDCPC